MRRGSPFSLAFQRPGLLSEQVPEAGLPDTDSVTRAGLQIAAVALIALLAIGQPALAANRRLLANTETSSVELLQAYVR